jgi:uncharacterized protein (DUF1015 family)
MATLKPFRALRPARDKAASVSAVPYDVVTTDEARALAEGNPLSFLHVSRAEIDLPDGTDPHSDAVYAKAAENFGKLKRLAPLTVESTPALYVYRLRTGPRTQTGIAGCSSLDEYDADVIRKHERTRKDKEDDRTRHMVTLKAQTGPVFMTYRDLGALDALVSQASREEPLFDFSAPDGVAHTVWRLSPESTERAAEAFRAVPLFYIADGHHRAASASRARAQLKAANRGHTGAEDYNFFLTVLFPAGQLKILPYNRVVKDLGGWSPEELLNAMRSRLTAREGSQAAPTRKGDISVFLDGRWHSFALPKPSGGGAIEALDADLLHRHVLEPLLKINDIRTDERIDFVGGIRGTKGLEKLVADGSAAIAFSLYPVSLDELMSISDASEIMPPKSTWFEPKLRDGLLIQML